MLIHPGGSAWEQALELRRQLHEWRTAPDDADLEFLKLPAIKFGEPLPEAEHRRMQLDACREPWGRAIGSGPRCCWRAQTDRTCPGSNHRFRKRRCNGPAPAAVRRRGWLAQADVASATGAASVRSSPGHPPDACRPGLPVTATGSDGQAGAAPARAMPASLAGAGGVI